MKKKVRGLTALLLSGVLLTGCTGGGTAITDSDVVSVVTGEDGGVESKPVDTRKLSEYATLRTKDWYDDEIPQGIPVLKENASIEKLNSVAHFYGMPADKSVTDAEYVDAVSNLTLDEAAAANTINVGKHFIAKTDRYLGPRANGLYSFDREAGKVEYCYTATPPEIYDAFSTSVIETSVQLSNVDDDAAGLIVGAEYEISNDSWTQGIPLVVMNYVVLNSDEEVVYIGTMADSKIYAVPYGVTVRGVATDIPTVKLEDADAADVNLEGLHLKLYFFIRAVQDANTWAVDFVDSDIYTAQLVATSDGYMSDLLVTNVSNEDIAFDSFKFYAEDTVGHRVSFESIYTDTLYTLHPGTSVCIKRDGNKGIVHNDLEQGYYKNSAYGLSYAGTDLLHADGVSVHAQLTRMQQEHDRVLTFDKTIYDESQDAYFVDYTASDGEQFASYNGVVCLSAVDGSSTLQRIEEINPTNREDERVENGFYLALRTSKHNPENYIVVARCNN